MKIEEKIPWRGGVKKNNTATIMSFELSETSGREVSHGPSLDIFFFEQISRNERFMKKINF